MILDALGRDAGAFYVKGSTIILGYAAPFSETIALVFMQEYAVHSSEELLDLLHDFKKGWAWIFRGQSDASWSLLPKVGRQRFQIPKFLPMDERRILESWKRYATHFLKRHPSDDWDWLTLAQHHGLATRLLDWTKNPLNAAFFAVKKNNGTDAAIFALEMMNGDLADVEDPFSVRRFSTYFPRGLSARVVNQRGLFTVSRKPSIPLEDQISDRLHKIVIDQSAVVPVRETLDLFGVNKLSIYQDLDSLSEYLNNYIIRLKADQSATPGEFPTPHG